MEPYRRSPEGRHDPSFAVRARRQRRAGMVGIGSLVAVTGYLVGGGADGVATSAVSAVSAVSADTVSADTVSADTTSATAVTAVIATTDATSTTTASTAPDDATALDDAATTCATTYTVVTGDSWYGIADAASVEVSALYGLNDAGDTTMLFPGDSICVPDGTVVTTTTPVVTTVAARAATANTTANTTANAVAAAPNGPSASSSHGS